MYKKYRSGLQDVTEEVYTRSLSNLSLLKDCQPVSVEEQLYDEEIGDKKEVENTVKECWEIVEGQCHHHANKKVFPELREWCRSKKLYLIDCDLRWGVPKDTPTCDTIAMCMEELDRCLLETQGQPFFLNLLGEKYGWIPAREDISENLQMKYNWVPNTSITFMEILHGAYRVDSPNALFMLRTSDIMNDIPIDKLSRFKDKEILGQQQLQELKTRLQWKFPHQVHRYTCRVEGMTSQGDRQRVNIVDLEDFAEYVLSFFKTAITRHFPGRINLTSSPTVNIVLEESEIQQRVMEEMANSCLGRKKDTEMLMSFINGQTDQFQHGEIKKPFSRDVQFWGSTMQTGNKLLCVSAPPGYGKTTLLALVTQLSLQKASSVFYHFCGSSCNSHDVMLLLKRLVCFLSQNKSDDFLTTIDKSSEDELKTKLRSLFEDVHQQSDTNKIIIIDSLNQLSTNDRVHHLSWLPPFFPPNVHCIVSTTSHPPTVSRIKEHPHYWLDLQTLDRTDARSIVQLFLKQFNKKLDEDQMNSIVSSECSKSPLWLYLVCEELRVYGDFTSLTKHVHAVTESVESVLHTILSRLLKEDDTGHLEKALCILDCSYGSLTTLDLQRLLGNIKEKEPLPTYLWTKIRRNLQAYLRIVHYNEQISFSHSLIKEAVSNKVMKDSKDHIKYYRLFADYIEYWCEDVNMKVSYLATYLELACLYDRLVNFFQKSPESTHIPPWKRSQFILKCRCTSLADPVIGKVSPVEICVFCQKKRAFKYPNAIFRNEDMCVVCGNQVHPGPFSVNAYLCPFHTPRGGFGPKQCYLCQNIIVNSPIQGRLCSHCGFGNYGKQCVALSRLK